MQKPIPPRVSALPPDAARCRTLSEMLPKAIILHGRGNDRELLQGENIDGTDALVAASDSDEMNLLISIYAKTKQVPKIITKVERMDIVEMYGNIGAGAIVSPRQLIANDDRVGGGSPNLAPGREKRRRQRL